MPRPAAGLETLERVVLARDLQMSGSPPQVSVVIPTYNRARYVGDAIESALSQTAPSVEVIVVDDGSTDETRAVAARYAPEARYFWQPNAERGAARNQGLRLARGAFVAFLDSDDVWAPDKLERDLALFRRRPEVGFVYSDIQLVDADLRLLRRVRRRGDEGWVTGRLLLRNFVSVGAHLARTGAMRDAGGFREERELAGSEDWETWVRLSTCVPFAYLPVATARIRVHSGNSLNHAAAMERSRRRACAVMETADYLTPAQRRLLPRTRAMLALASARSYCRDGDPTRAWAHLREAIRHSPAAVLDPRFGYVGLHSLLTPSLSARLRGLERQILTAHDSRSYGRIAARDCRGATPRVRFGFEAEEEG